MIYMNAKNNLEPAAIQNFCDMAKIGSTKAVNVVVELGRPAKSRYVTDASCPGQALESGAFWTGVLRFRVIAGMQPVLPAATDRNDDAEVRTADMGSAATMRSFVRWSKGAYPAQHYMLLVWNHGQGWRVFAKTLAAAQTQALALKLPEVTAVRAPGRAPSAAPPGRSVLGGFRSVSFDDDSQHFLYNRDIEESLQGDNRVDVVGFDACLMQMIETAYAFRSVASVLVASEELDPNAGWDYSSWLASLAANPRIDAKGLSVMLVDSYAAEYGNSGYTNLSAIDLSGIKALARSLGTTSSAIDSRLTEEIMPLSSARRSLLNFGDWYSDSWYNCDQVQVLRFHGIDLASFLANYSKATQNSKIRNALAQLRSALQRVILKNYASSKSVEQYGASGLAVYFPGSTRDYSCDTDGAAYDPKVAKTSAVAQAPEFVSDISWSTLIQHYLATSAAQRGPLDR
jgi:hypothetical protein